MLNCGIYLAVTGILSFFLGRCLRHEYMDWNRFPYSLYNCEKDGSIYRKIRIHHWQNKVPDMSNIFPGMMPPKRLVDTGTAALRRMIQETCMAELVHGVLCVTGLYCIVLWPGIGGIVISVLNILLFNLPFILIQRYNRPRLVRLYDRLSLKERVSASCQR